MNPTARRVERLLKLLFAEIQQREAARQIGITQSLLSRTLSGEREPSKTLLEKLGSFPGVNLRWLLDGVGDPLTEGGTTLPVIERLPTKPKTKWEELEKEAERFWVSEARFSETRYWWRMNKKTLRSWGDCSLKCKATAGDYLLLETDRTQIEAMSLDRRLVVVSHSEIKSGKPSWGILDNKMQFTPFMQDSSSATDQHRSAVKKNRSAVKKPRRRIKGMNSASLGREPGLNPADQKKALQESQPAELTHVAVEFEHIMAIVIEMTSTSVLKT